MNLNQRIRSATGGLAVVVLLSLVVLDVVHPGITLSLEDKLFLASIASALLGVDFALNQGPLNVQIWSGTNDQSSGGQDDE